mmetsp:Transcript_25184/g.84596  ORF Transcript_25184/g.84596 Transcript_25184/m.84596 type:complete len:206 (+) Transcript_25184:1723-2340(+)
MPHATKSESVKSLDGSNGFFTLLKRRSQCRASMAGLPRSITSGICGWNSAMAKTKALDTSDPIFLSSAKASAPKTCMLRSTSSPRSLVKSPSVHAPCPSRQARASAHRRSTSWTFSRASFNAGSSAEPAPKRSLYPRYVADRAAYWSNFFCCATISCRTASRPSTSPRKWSASTKQPRSSEVVNSTRLASSAPRSASSWSFCSVS